MGFICRGEDYVISGIIKTGSNVFVLHCSRLVENWLLTGQGEMLKKEVRPKIGDVLNPERTLLVALLDDYSEWKAGQTGQTYKAVKANLKKKASLILSGLDQ